MDEADREVERAETQASEELSRPSSSISSSTISIDRTISHHPTHIERYHSARIQHTHTVGSRRDDSAVSVLPKSIGGGKPFPPDIPAEREAYVVDFDGPNDPLHPMNWKLSRKLVVSAIGALACFCSTFASSVLSVASPLFSRHFGFGLEVGSLASALYLVGYAVGPACWAPLSELRGRKLPLILGNFGFSVFAIATAVSKDTQTLMISRFFMGVFGSSPLVVVAGLYSDIWRTEQRGPALVIFATSVFMGPMIGPIVGAYTVLDPSLSWRWDCYWSAIMGFTTFGLIVLFLKETYPPAVLVSKAAELRRRTKNWAIHAKQEEIEIDLRELISKNVSRPMRMLVTEPILLLIGFYLSFVYGLIYITLAVLPIVFGKIHHFEAGVAELPFLSIAVGMVLAGASSIAMNPSWVRKLHASGRPFAEPEWRLPLAAVGGVVFTVGLFWLGWTGHYGQVHWVVPLIGAAFVGYGLLAIFMQLIMYIIDAYLMFAASAIAGNTIIRSLFAASCPMFDRQMFAGLGVQWAMTLLGALALILIPVPLVFMKYGPALRKKSKFAPTFGPPAPTPAPTNGNDEEKALEAGEKANGTA